MRSRARQAQRRSRGRAPVADALKTERDQLTERRPRCWPSATSSPRAVQSAAKESRGQGGRPAEGDRAPAARADAARRLARGGQQREGQAVRRPHRGAEADRRAESRRGAPDRRARRAEGTSSARLNAALDAADAKAKDQQAQIVDLGQKLNRALASKVEELARYRSEFFGKLREALAGQRDVQIVGDRFVFQSEVLFPSGSAQLQPAGEKQLAEVAQRLIEIASRIPKDINWVLQVDGHTDDKPINNVVFPSNWELSAARAIAVVKFLHSQGIPNERLVAAGYGEYQPLSAIDTARNRRIELKLTNR